MQAGKSPDRNVRRRLDPRINLRRDLAVFNEFVAKYTQELANGVDLHVTLIVTKQPCPPPAGQTADLVHVVPDTQPSISVVMITSRGLALQDRM